MTGCGHAMRNKTLRENNILLKKAVLVGVEVSCCLQDLDNNSKKNDFMMRIINVVVVNDGDGARIQPKCR